MIAHLYAPFDEDDTFLGLPLEVHFTLALPYTKLTVCLPGGFGILEATQLPRHSLQ